jgi:2',3'-cyclic-nucleotide 2'-phosphodiesterase (5'-nucleotidase family)
MNFARRILIALCLLSAILLGAQRPTRILVLHTNDLHGQLLPRNGFGGLAEIATLVRNAAPDLMLDAGDKFTGTLLNDEFEGVPIIQAMNRIGFQASAIGNHEFDYGLEPLRARLREAVFPNISANIQTGLPEIRKYTVIAVKGIRFGIIGLTLEDLKERAHPDKVRDVNVQDVVRALQETLPEVRTQSDFVILLTHVTNEEEKRIAAAFPEIRLIISGHDHSRTGYSWEKQTMITRTGSSGRNLGRVDMEFSGATLKSLEARIIPVRDVSPDPEVAALLRPFEAKVAEKMSAVVGHATEDMVKSDTSESSLANHIADAFRAAGQSEIAFHNIGGIRAGLSGGPVTWGAVFEVLPFQNILFKLKLSGSQVKRILNHSFIAVSGLRVVFDLHKPMGGRLVRVTMSDGSPIDDEASYTVTTNDFVVAGGDGFAEFARGKEIQNTGVSLRDAFAEYIRSQGVLSPLLDGRIVIVN